jgi:hypothetical protein
VIRALGVRQRVDRIRAGTDSGVTLMDVMMSMVLMSVVMSIFTGGMLQMFSAGSRTQQASDAQSQVNLSFIRLDKEIRYASAISTEGLLVGGDPVVEYLSTNTGARNCTELRLNVATSVLQLRTWVQPDPPAVPVPPPVGPTPSGWSALASDISSAAPFTFQAADETFNFQRLELKLTSGAAGGTSMSRQTDVTFTALNTTLQTVSPTECTEMRLIP